MHHRIRVLSQVALSLLALLAADAASALASPPARALAIELDRSSPLVPDRVAYQWTIKGLEIEGRIVKSRDRYGRILGHVEIDLLDSSGLILARHSAALQRFSPRRKDPDWASFWTVIETVPADVVQLRVHHAVGSRN